MNKEQESRLYRLELAFGELSSVQFRLWTNFKILVFFYVCKNLNLDAIAQQLHKLQPIKYSYEEVRKEVRNVLYELSRSELLLKRMGRGDEAIFKPTELGKVIFRLIKEYTGLR